MRTTIMMSVKPLILGCSDISIKTAFSLFIRYSLRSYIFVKKLPFFYRLMPFVSFVELSASSNDRFFVMSLEHFTREYGESTYLLVPCTERYRDFIERNRDVLENKFIIRHPEDILSKKDIFPLTSKERSP